MIDFGDLDSHAVFRLLESIVLCPRLPHRDGGAVLDVCAGVFAGRV